MGDFYCKAFTGSWMPQPSIRLYLVSNCGKGFRYLPPQSEDGTDSDGCGTDYEWIIGDNVQTSATDGVEHSVKIFVGINTFENGEPVADGVQRVWLDDELVFEKTDWIYDWTGTHLYAPICINTLAEQSATSTCVLIPGTETCSCVTLFSDIMSGSRTSARFLSLLKPFDCCCRIEQLQFHNFHGGSDPKKFGPDRLQVILFDDVAIQEGECPPGEDYDPEFVEKSATCNENPPAPSAPLPVNPPRAPPMIPDQCIASGKCGDWEGQTFCCEGDLECVRKNDFYYACREVGEIPDLKENEWGGEIYRNGVVVDGPLPDNPAPDDPAPDDPAPPSPSVPSQCIASGKCGGEDGQTACCEGELECVRKNQYYYACREVADICTLRDSGWEGKIYRDGEQVDPDEVACDFKEEEDDDEVDWVEPPTESCDILPSVPTYKKCGDETGKIACCTSDDLCLRKDGYYAQCRPENKKKSDWWNFEL